MHGLRGGCRGSSTATGEFRPDGDGARWVCMLSTISLVCVCGRGGVGRVSAAVDIYYGAGHVITGLITRKP